MDLEKLDELKKQIAEATDFMKPFVYFMDHFGDSEEFIDFGDRVSHPKLEAMLALCAANLVGKDLIGHEAPRVSDFLIVQVHDSPFLHGACRVNGKVANFIYFDDVQLGLMAVLPTRLGGETLIQRFTARDLPRGMVPSEN
jgi:hypothetical protein